MDARTDRELVEASRRGQHAAFGELVARYQALVCAVSYSSTGDRGLSEDVAQDTFVAAWRQLDQLRDVRAIRSWLCGIARNLGRKARKRARLDRRAVGVEAEEIPAATSPFEDIAQAEIEQVVRRALTRVPESCREVLVLYYREHHSIRDVAGALGISEPAVMQRLSRGRRHLAAEVTELVERSLADARPRRDLVAAVLATIVALAIPARVEAAPTKGSPLLKLTLAGSALVAAGTIAHVARARRPARPSASRSAAPGLHFGRPGVHPQLPSPRTPLPTLARAAITSDVAMLPADAEAVIGIDVAQLRRSALWQRFVGPRVDPSSLEQIPPVAAIEARCGFDPLASVESITIGVAGLNTPSLRGVVVAHGVDRSRTMACVSNGAPGSASDGARLAVDGDIVRIGDGDGDAPSVGFVFVDATTAVAVFGAAITTSEVAQAAAGGGRLDASPAFADMFDNIHREDAIWLVLTPANPLFAQANHALATQGVAAPLRVDALYGSIDIADELVLDARLRLRSTAQVAWLVDAIQQALDEPAAELLVDSFCDAIDVTPDGTDMRVNASVTGDQLLALASATATMTMTTTTTTTTTTTEARPTNDRGGAPSVTVDVSLSAP